MSLLIAERYTRALFQTCQKISKCDVVRRDLNLISQCINHSDEFSCFLKSAIVSPDKKQALMKKIFEKKIDDTTYRFLCFLIHKNRLDILPLIRGIYEDLDRSAKGVLKAKITSDDELDPKQSNKIIKRLKSRWNKDVEPDYVVDKNMIGGVRIQQGDTIYDYSIKSQLDRFYKKLMKV
jgi:F-type H+-transporting ATPase subunit delta